MEKIQVLRNLLHDIKKELSHVTWPNKKDMTISIIIVTIAVLVAGSIFFAADYLLYNFVQLLIKL